MATESNTRVLVVGAGSVGLIYAGLLSRAPNVQVSLFARSNYQALKDNGADIKSPDMEHENFHFTPADVLNNADSYNGEPFDYVVVSTKSLGTAALPGLGKFIDPKRTLLLLLQNGINIEKPYREAYPDVALVSAVVRVAASLNGPTEATFAKFKFALVVGLVHSEPGTEEYFQKRLVALEGISKEARADFSITQNIIKDRWEKMLWNGTFNTLLSVMNLTTGEFFEAGLEPLAHKVMREIWTVGRTIVGDDWVPESRVDSLIDYTRTHVPFGFLPSTLQDVRKGNEIEIEAIVGNSITVAKEHNVEVPMLEMLYSLLQGVNYKIKLHKKL